MILYKIEGLITSQDVIERYSAGQRAAYQENREIALKTDEFNCKLSSGSIFVSEICGEILTIGVIVDKIKNIEKIQESFCKKIGIDISDITCEEITIADFKHMADRADRGGFIRDSEDLLEEYKLDRLSPRGFRGAEFGESIGQVLNRKKITRIAEKYLMDSLLPELDRIYAGKQVPEAKGHPVQYLLRADSDKRNTIYQCIQSALYENGRLDSRRYAYIDFRPGSYNIPPSTYEALYEISKGGCIVVRYYGDDPSDDEYASGEREMLEMIAKYIKKYHNSVLTIVCLANEAVKAKDTLLQYLGNVCMIEIEEGMVKGDSQRARDYLGILAKGNHVSADEELLSKLEEDKLYSSNDLHELFDSYYDEKLKESVFPQYKACISAKQEAAKQKPQGSAYSRLQEMIGLDEAKQVMDKALDFYKMQKLFQEQGVSTEKPALNFLFTGPAGCGKTQVAQLYGAVLKENGILTSGEVHIHSRATLCAKYVGQTAANIQEIFKQCRGSVLFIDECYALQDNHNGGYGQEAINEIVNCADQYRGEICIIMAGYEEPMLEFIKQNPGLSSRVPFQVHFSNYSTEELCAIADLMRGHLGLKFGEGVNDKLAEIFDRARDYEDFGNGRYVRNLFDLSRMNQASRILKSDLGSIGREDLFMLTADDIEAPVIKEQEKVTSTIGFCA